MQRHYRLILLLTLYSLEFVKFCLLTLFTDPFYIRLLLGVGGEPTVVPPDQEPFTCPQCDGRLKFVRELERLPSPRGPPVKQLCFTT